MPPDRGSARRPSVSLRRQPGPVSQDRSALSRSTGSLSEARRGTCTVCLQCCHFVLLLRGVGTRGMPQTSCSTFMAVLSRRRGSCATRAPCSAAFSRPATWPTEPRDLERQGRRVACRAFLGSQKMTSSARAPRAPAQGGWRGLSRKFRERWHRRPALLAALALAGEGEALTAGDQAPRRTPLPRS